MGRASPFGSSSAGFTYTFDPALGVYNRSTQTFGPIFSERPITAGKGKFSFGVNYQQAHYDQLEGRSLEDGDVKAKAEAALDSVQICSAGRNLQKTQDVIRT